MEKIVTVFQADMSSAANAFFEEGLGSFHRSRSPAQQQVALVNMAIGCELLMKAYLARKSAPLIFDGLSPEDEVALHCPKDISGGKRSNSALKLKFRELKTKQFDACLNMVFALKPKLKEKYGSGLRRLVLIRNLGAHCAFPAHAAHEVDRSAYIALKLYDELSKDAKCWRLEKKEDKTFLKRFSEETNVRIKKTLEEARKRFQNDSFSAKDFNRVPQDWEEYSTECPVCDCGARLEGTTEHDGQMVAEDEYDENLTFLTSSLECEACGLKLASEEELRLAGVDTVIDRSEDLNHWPHEEADYEPDEDWL